MRSLVEAFPTPDKEVRGHFLKFEDGTLPEVVKGKSGPYYQAAKARVLIFLRELFVEVASHLEKLPNSGSRDALAAAWRQCLASKAEGDTVKRESLYGVVVGRSEARTKDWYGGIVQTTVEDLGEEVLKKVKYLERLIDEKGPGSSTREADFRQNVSVLIYFDEADALTKATIPNDKSGRTLYNALMSCLADLAKSDLFAVTLSTSSNLAELAPSIRWHPSTRVTTGGIALQAPFTELPFDCFQQEGPFVQPENVKLDLLGQDEFLVRFGRPLYVPLFYSLRAINNG